MRITLIIPAYNEEEALPLVIEEYKDKVDEIIVVDDGSSDRTYDIAKSYDIKLCRHEKNEGKVAAIRTGIENASGELIILTDADFTYPAEYVPVFINKIDEGTDLVLGSRSYRSTKNMPIFNKLGNNIFSFLTSYFSGKEIKDGQTGYRAFKKNMFPYLDVDAKSLEWETKMTIKTAKLGYKISEVPITYRERIGKSKLRPIKDGYKMLKAIFDIVISETSTLAKVVMFPSIIFLLIGIGFGSISMIEKIKAGVLTNEYFPILSALFILLAIQLFSMGVILDNLTKRLDRIEDKIERNGRV